LDREEFHGHKQQSQLSVAKSPSPNGPRLALVALEQSHKAEIHVRLHVAMEETEARSIGAAGLAPTA